MSRNRLHLETSPYLLQHRDNPVHWQPWDAQALGQARDQGKPILLSIGYAACHWCHVMAHESFEDPSIAQLMNTDFVNIKVDREERPDLDSLYQTALAVLGQAGGWPLTLFLTSEAEPFWGGTYFPPQPRFGRPAFPSVLSAIATAYRTQPDRIRETVAALRHSLLAAVAPPSGPTISPSALETTASHVLEHMDPVHGGLAGAPKFPQVPLLRMLWRARPDGIFPSCRPAVLLALQRMSQGGIYDHLGGGFARYSTDDQWLVPHFEKMLYDNALLIDLLSEVWRATRTPLLATRVQETVRWLLDEMTVHDPANPDRFAFASALDADAEGQEGRYYLWAAAEIDSLLGTDSSLFKSHYDVRPEGNWDGFTILRSSVSSHPPSPSEDAILARCRDVLLSARAQRVAPQRDHKVLADANGLAITALVRAGTTFDRPDWIAVARNVFDCLRHHLAAPDDRLLRTWCDGQARHRGVLDDYAHLARAAIALFEATRDRSFLDQACDWADSVHAHHWDDHAGGYFLSPHDADDLFLRTKPLTDGALPSGNGVMLGVLARLHPLTGIDRYRKRAEELVRALSPSDPELLFSMPTFLTALQTLEDPVRIVISGDPSLPATRALDRVVAETAPLSAIITRDSHPSPAVHLCRGTVCELPFADPPLLHRRLSEL